MLLQQGEFDATPKPAEPHGVLQQGEFYATPRPAEPQGVLLQQGKLDATPKPAEPHDVLQQGEFDATQKPAEPQGVLLQQGMFDATPEPAEPHDVLQQDEFDATPKPAEPQGVLLQQCKFDATPKPAEPHDVLQQGKFVATPKPPEPQGVLNGVDIVSATEPEHIQVEIRCALKQAESECIFQPAESDPSFFLYLQQAELDCILQHAEMVPQNVLQQGGTDSTLKQGEEFISQQTETEFVLKQAETEHILHHADADPELNIPSHMDIYDDQDIDYVPDSNSDSSSDSEWDADPVMTDGKRKRKQNLHGLKKVCGVKDTKEPQYVLQKVGIHFTPKKAETECRKQAETERILQHAETEPVCDALSDHNSYDDQDSDYVQISKSESNTNLVVTGKKRNSTQKHHGLKKVCRVKDTKEPQYVLQKEGTHFTPEKAETECRKQAETERILQHAEPVCDAPLDHDLNDEQNSKKTYKKPYRYCIFCKRMMAKLRGHMVTMHQDEERVRQACKLGKKDKDLAFDALKKEGILELNKLRIRKNPDNAKLERERKKDTSHGLVMCQLCKGFMDKRYITRHEKMHYTNTEAAVRVVPVPASMISVDEELGGDFLKEIVSKFREGEDSEVYDLCIKDPVLLQIGKKLWNKHKRKEDKRTEVRKSVMADMRRLASLYSKMKKVQDTLGEMPVKDGNISDMYKRNNFRHLEEAIDVYTSRTVAGTGIKAGLKIALYYLLKSTSKILRGMYLIDDQDEKSSDVANWVVVLEMNKDLIFGDATYAISKNREETLRRPQRHPEEEDLQKIRRHTLKRIGDLCEPSKAALSVHEFVELRDCLVCRLTLFNARRGGEPCRLTVKNWEEAYTGAWLDQRHVDNLDPLDQALANSIKVGYQTGKGRHHLVSVLFPQDCVVGLTKLADQQIRGTCGIADKNNYLFPSKNGSLSHVSGWHSVKKICEKLELKEHEKITATSNRHRVSTEFALMDVPVAERDYIYKHLGHSEEINRNVYQAPLAIKAITVVGRRLQALDRGGKCINYSPLIFLHTLVTVGAYIIGFITW